MYPAHFVAGLAVKGAVPKAPTWALMTAVFLPDLAWIVLARAGVEPEAPHFFDDWSHSLLSILVLASLFALAFLRQGRIVALAVWIAGLSHFFLDFLIHPAKLALYPHSSIHLGWNLWHFGQQKTRFGPNNYWWIELAMMLPLLAVFTWYSRRARFDPKLVAASCLLVLGLHLLSA